MPTDPTPCRMREKVVYVCDEHATECVVIGGMWRCPTGWHEEMGFFWDNGYALTLEGWTRLPVSVGSPVPPEEQK